VLLLAAIVQKQPPSSHAFAMGTGTEQDETVRSTKNDSHMPEETPPSPPERNAAADDTVPASKTILLVEDEEAIMAIGKEILETTGYTVLTASTPQEAIDLFQRSSDVLHLLVTDVILPEMNGKELASALKETRPDLSVLFTSGYSSEVLEDDGILLEEVRFIQKPYSIGDFLQQVRELLDESFPSAYQPPPPGT